MIIDNTVANAAHEIFNVLEGMSYRDAKAALERVADELENNLFVGEPDDDEDEDENGFVATVKLNLADDVADVLENNTAKLEKIRDLVKELAKLGIKYPNYKAEGLNA